jgi:hypothetical protein
MIQQFHDPGIARIKARKDHSCYGMGLGIIILDEVYPGFPGDVRNASAFPYPIQYEICEHVDIQRLVYADDNSACLEPILRAARKLERMGCRAIAAECGYFACFQKDVAGQVDVPVFMSSLLQVPLAQQIVGPDKEVGIFCALQNQMTERHLRNVGIDPASNIAIGGAMDFYYCREFDNLWTEGKRPACPGADYAKAEEEFVRSAAAFVADHPRIGALVLECTGFPPFARAVQRALDLPVFSWGTLMDFAYSVTVHRDYYGHV